MKMNENGIKKRLKFSLLVAFAPLVLRKLNTNKGERRLLDAMYGIGNYSTKSQSEYSKIKKWGDRAFE
jgi:hypothetical protein